MIGKASANIAFYLLNDTYQQETMKLQNLSPRSEPYIYNFTVSNQKGERVSDVDLKYTLKLKSTTNLPLRYKLYMNEDYRDSDATNLVTESTTTIEPDEDGTYFLIVTLPSEELIYSSPKTNSYTLLIYFDEVYTDAKYQDTIESIRIIINSQQMIE